MNAKAKRAAKPETVKQRGRCPICGQPSRHETRPFCSQRCADRDLARWLGGAYRIPSEERPGERPGERPDEDRAGEALSDDATPTRRH